MTQDNLIARIEDAELALAHWDEGRNSEYWLRHPVPIERLSPPLDEGVSEPTRRMERILGAKFEPKDLSAISTPREDEVERMARALAVALPRMREVPFEHWSPKLQDETRILARAAIAALTPREQIRAEAFEEAAKVAEDFYDNRFNISSSLQKKIAAEIRALSSLPAPLSLQDKT